MNTVEFSFLEKAIFDKNYVSFIYDGKRYKDEKPLELYERADMWFLRTDKKIFEFEKLKRVTIQDDRFD